MTAIAEILHNVADHTEVLWTLLNDLSVPPDIVARLKQHILLEEAENTAKLQAIQELAPSVLVQKLMDHSFLLQRMIQEPNMTLELQKELLHHFMEEHQEWTEEVSTDSTTGKDWTVGPLWPQGG